MVHGAALEKRFPSISGRGLESHPLRHQEQLKIDNRELKIDNKKNEIGIFDSLFSILYFYTTERCWSGLTGTPGERVSS